MEQVHHPNIFPPPSQPWATTNLFFSLYSFIFSRMSYNSVQFSHSVVSDSLQPHGLQHAYLSITNSQSLHKLMSIELVMSSNHLILWCPLILCPQSFPPSGTFPMSRLFTSSGQNTGASAPSNEYSVLMSLTIDWFDLLTVQGTLSSPLQCHSLKASVLIFLFRLYLKAKYKGALNRHES